MTVTGTIIANNTAVQSAGKDVATESSARVFTSGGNNRLGNAAPGFTHGMSGDHIGAVDYVVTGLADTVDPADDSVVLSVRESIEKANSTAGNQEIWLPAWKFLLTRERDKMTHPTDIDALVGDLDITQPLTIRGVNGTTSVAWQDGLAADREFELVGDYNNDGVVDTSPSEVDAADYVTWQNAVSIQDLAADGNDDEVVDSLDYDIWRSKFGYWLMVYGVTT